MSRGLYKYLQNSQNVQYFNMLKKEMLRYALQVHSNKKGEQEIGESWSYLGISTFVPVSVVRKAEEAIKRLENDNRGEKSKRANRPCSQCNRP